MTRRRSGRPNDRFQAGTKGVNIPFSESSRLALGPIQSPVKRVPVGEWSELEADHSSYLVPRQAITGAVPALPIYRHGMQGTVLLYYYYFIVILTTSEAFLPAVHRSNMKQRKFRLMLIALINSALQLHMCSDASRCQQFSVAS